MNEFDNLKVGDEVILVNVEFGYTQVRSVQKVQKTLLRHVMVDGRRFKKISGHETGSGPYLGFILAATHVKIAQVRAENERAGIAIRLERVKWRKLPLEFLREINRLVAGRLATLTEGTKDL